MRSKIKILMFSVLLLLVCVSCAENQSKPTNNNFVSAGNIQNGGYAVEYENGYIYKDYENGALLKRDVEANTVEYIADGHLFSELNIYNDEIYYLNGNPGAIWKMSMEGKSKKQLTHKRAAHLIVSNDHIYFRLSEEDDWGKLYRTDLNGRNAKLLADCVLNFCIYNDRVYYTDIAQAQSKICSMKTDGTDVVIVSQAEANNLLAVENMLIYSDKNRADRIFVYDFSTDTETCICEDRCWNVNANREWIFYRNQSDKGNLYRIRLDGSERQKVAEGNIVDVLVIGSRVLYRYIESESQFKSLDFRHGW